MDTSISVNQQLQIITDMTLIRMSLDDPENEKMRTLDFLANKLQLSAQTRLRQKMFTGIKGANEKEEA